MGGLAFHEKFARQWQHSPFLTWGLGPSLLVVFTYVFTVMALEFVKVLGLTKGHEIVYLRNEVRQNEINRTREKIGKSRSDQFAVAMWILLGPLNIFGALFNTFVLSSVVGNDPPTPDWNTFLLHMLVLAIIADFFLYWVGKHFLDHLLPLTLDHLLPLTLRFKCMLSILPCHLQGHRIQHELDYLWINYHSLHHTLSTPEPVGTIYIDGIDAALQAGIPLLLSPLLVR
jgi:hypothetical protein